MNDDHITPTWLIEELKKEFEEIDLDPCASNDQTQWFAKTNFNPSINNKDGLQESWNYNIVFINPPYSHGNIPKWIDKAWTECYMNQVCHICILLLPVDTSTRWFKRYFCYTTKSTKQIEYYTLRDDMDIRFIKRFTFSEMKLNSHAKFPSMIVVLKQEDSTY